MIVTDASAVLDVLLHPADVAPLAKLLLASTDPLAAPDLLDVEVLSVLCRWERRGDITARRAAQALDDLGVLPIVRHPARALTQTAWRLRHTLTAYDAQYVALAQILAARLLTTDQRMANAARAAGVPAL